MVVDHIRNYRRMLRQYVPRTSYIRMDNPRILNLGCGACEEGRELSDYFGCSDILGIDMGEDEIKMARQINQRLPARFVRGNYADLHKLVEGPFDVVVARHPAVTYMEHKAELTGALMHAGRILSVCGIFIGTTYDADGAANLSEVLRICRFQPLPVERNIFSQKRREFGLECFWDVNVDGFVVLATPQD